MKNRSRFSGQRFSGHDFPVRLWRAVLIVTYYSLYGIALLSMIGIVVMALAWVVVSILEEPLINIAGLSVGIISIVILNKVIKKENEDV